MLHAVYHRFAAAGYRGLVRDDWRAALSEADPWLRWLDGPHETVWQRQASRTVRVPPAADHPALFVKHIAPPDRARLLRRSPVQNTLAVTRRLLAAGFEAPHVVLAADLTARGRTEHLLITEAVDGQSVESRLLQSPNIEATRRLLIDIGREVARLHRARFLHGDLLPGNLIRRPDGVFVFLDNDRTRRLPVLPFWLRRRNLSQMMFRCLSILPWAEAEAFFAGYFEAMNLPRPRRRYEQQWVLRFIRPRIARLYHDHGHTRRAILQRRDQQRRPDP
ncbi:MAG: hypothetical protein GC162_18670 [Planctomycetes bacterium]|nr:hypothetical protein [Planctomycetota bacterium]